MTDQEAILFQEGLEPYSMVGWGDSQTRAEDIKRDTEKDTFLQQLQQKHPQIIHPLNFYSE